VSYLPAIWKACIAALITLFIGGLIKTFIGIANPLLVALSISLTTLTYIICIFLFDKDIVNIISTRLLARFKTT